MPQDQTPQDMLGMSDEEFMNLNSPPDVDEGSGTQQPDLVDQQKQEDQSNVDEQNQEEDSQLPPEGGDKDPDTKNEEDPDADQQKEEDDPEKLESQQKDGDKLKDSDKLSKDKSGEESDKDASKEAKPEEKTTPPNYEELYKKLMAPIRANGKTIELKSPEELVQLAQMGANYTKKMQAIQPYRKVLLMLENNGLLDENRLSYLIDLDKKNPDAIKKLVKDAGIDPLQIDTEQDTTYKLGNHRVSDEEAGFVSALDDLKSTQEGTQTLQAINTWDQASKEVLWKNPDLMNTIHDQRANGIYDLIATEVERQRTLGTIPSHVPFINAYKAVGDYMNAQGAFSHLAQKQTGPVDKTPVTTRVQQPKPVVKNGDKVSAATPSRSSQKKAEPFINPLSLSDEEFEKQFANRL